MSTQTDTPEIMVAAFEWREDGTYMTGRTKDGLEVVFKVHPMALGLLAITAQPALKEELARAEREHPAPQPPAAPDTPEGLEG